MRDILYIRLISLIIEKYGRTSCSQEGKEEAKESYEEVKNKNAPGGIFVLCLSFGSKMR